MKNHKLLIIAAFLLVAFHASAQDTETVTTAELADRIVREGERYAGVPYRMGANGPKAFDCSGFVRTVYSKFGFDLPHSSEKMSKLGTPVEGSMSELQKGDLVFFSGRKGGNNVGHVGIYIGPDDTDGSFTFIHAAVRGGVQVSHLREQYYSSRFLGACRILPTFYPPVPAPDSVDVPIPVGKVEIQRDTLRLGPGDMRIIVFASGGWARVDEDGNLAAPDMDSRIVLNPNGTWSSVKMSTHAIPSLSSEQASVKDTSDSVATAAVSETVQNAAVDDPAPAEVFHTVRKGETLYSISKKYGTSVQVICNLNGINAKSVLNIGKILRVK